jgi:23S rRNA pseudouridine2605 synthase
MRIQKVIAQSGVTSRRQAEAFILEGRVKVNNVKIYRPGHIVDPKNDVISIDDKVIPKQQALSYYALHKPRGYITARNDPEERPSVFGLLSNVSQRLEPVGRLDINTSGLLLFTNDGHLSQKLLHPSTEIPTRFSVKVWKSPNEKKLMRIRKGLVLEDGRTKPAKVRSVDSTDSNNTWLEITVTESRNRLIKRMFDAIGHPVSKLQRLSFATIGLGKLPQGLCRPLTKDEVNRLKEIASGTPPEYAGAGSRYKKGYARPKPKPNKPLSRKNKGRKR